MKTYKLGLLFAGLPVSDSERFRVGQEMEKVGGLTFKVEISEGGWVAQCNEINGIIAGNKNTNPTDVEIESEIRQAILSAFGVKFEEKSVQSPYKFEYEIATNSTCLE